MFLVKNAKNENRLCPLPYEEVLEDIIKTGWTSRRIEMPGEGCTSLPILKPG